MSIEPITSIIVGASFKNVNRVNKVVKTITKYNTDTGEPYQLDIYENCIELNGQYYKDEENLCSQLGFVCFIDYEGNYCSFGYNVYLCQGWDFEQIITKEDFNKINNIFTKFEKLTGLKASLIIEGSCR